MLMFEIKVNKIEKIKTNFKNLKMECNVCISEYNKNKHRKVECPYCQYECCRECFMTYTKELTILDNKCMNCSKVFSNNFIASNTSNNFFNKILRDAKTAIVLSIEKSRLPDTQEEAENILKDENFYDKLSKFKTIIKVNKKILKTLREEITSKWIRSENVSELREEVKELLDDNKEMNTVIRRVYQEYEESYTGFPTQDKKKPVKKFIKKCGDENCKGFVSTAYKCGICSKFTCSKCNVIKKCHDDKTHECDPDMVATIAALKSECVNCPKCQVHIFRSEGCPQMWCVNCNTAFDWNTGEIDTGRVHNPHYFDYIRQNNMNEDHLGQCEIDVGRLQRKIDKFQNGGVLELIVMLRNEISELWINQYRIIREDFKFRKFRVNYLLNRLEENKWFDGIKRTQKKNQKNQEILDILNTFIEVSKDLINSYTYDQNKDNYEEIILQFNNLREYVNRELYKVQEIFNNKTPFINKHWKWIS